MNKFLRSLLRTSVRMLEQSDRVLAALDGGEASGLGDFEQRPFRRLNHQDKHVAVNMITFAAGIGLGLGVGLLVAPASGKEIRGSMVGKVREFSNKARDRFSSEATHLPTGTAGK